MHAREETRILTNCGARARGRGASLRDTELLAPFVNCPSLFLATFKASSTDVYIRTDSAHSDQERCWVSGFDPSTGTNGEQGHAPPLERSYAHQHRPTASFFLNTTSIHQTAFVSRTNQRSQTPATEMCIPNDRELL